MKFVKYPSIENMNRLETINAIIKQGFSGGEWCATNKVHGCFPPNVNEYTSNTPIELHHIDGDYKNNKESNLQLLCPNYHSLTATYKAANKASTRTHR
jgi:hypothetical protein